MRISFNFFKFNKMKNNILLEPPFLWCLLDRGIKKVIGKNASLFTPGFPRKALSYGILGFLLLVFTYVSFWLSYSKVDIGPFDIGPFIGGYLTGALSVACFLHAWTLYKNHRLLQHAYTIVFLANFLESHQDGFTEEFKDFLARRKMVDFFKTVALSFLNKYVDRVGSIEPGMEECFLKEGRAALTDWKKKRNPDLAPESIFRLDFLAAINSFEGQVYE